MKYAAKYYKKRKTFRKTKKVAKAVRSYVRRAIAADIEDKFYYDIVQNVATPFFLPIDKTAWDTHCLSNIQTGLLYNNKIGDRCRMKYLDLRVNIIGFTSFNSLFNTTSYANVIRFVIFCDKRNNGASPQGQELFTQAIGVNLDQTTAHYNPTVVPSRYQILRDVTVNMPVAALTYSSSAAAPQEKAAEPMIRHFRYKIPLKGKNLITQQGTVSGVTNVILSGGLFFAIIQSNPDTDNVVAGYRLSSRLCFEDA